MQMVFCLNVVEGLRLRGFSPNWSNFNVNYFCRIQNFNVTLPISTPVRKWKRFSHSLPDFFVREMITNRSWDLMNNSGESESEYCPYLSIFGMCSQCCLKFPQKLKPRNLWRMLSMRNLGNLHKWTHVFKGIAMVFHSHFSMGMIRSHHLESSNGIAIGRFNKNQSCYCSECSMDRIHKTVEFCSTVLRGLQY